MYSDPMEENGPRAGAAESGVCELGDLAALEAWLIKRAPRTDTHDADLNAELNRLSDDGYGAAVLPVELGGRGWAHGVENIDAVLEFLRMLGRANLSVGRLYEGHLNAVKLLILYAEASLLEDIAVRVRDGAWLGVWGADGAKPVSFDGQNLQGGKNFASGIGMIDYAVVSAGGDAIQLTIAPCNDAARGDASTWNVSGMRATQSGAYDFEGVPAQALGKPGEYLTEPWFEGGVWRYCAVHCGAIEALRDEVFAMSEKRGHTSDPHQRVRLAELSLHCETARLWITQAAHRVESGQGDAQNAAAYALLAREATERACVAAMTVADRALGTAAHAEASRAGRIRRDLGLFLRQADLDGKLDRATTGLLQVAGDATAL